jgi:hypothetical protein
MANPNKVGIVVAILIGGWHVCSALLVSVALPAIIANLQSRGFHLVTISTLLGTKGAAALTRSASSR